MFVGCHADDSLRAPNRKFGVREFLLEISMERGKVQALCFEDLWSKGGKSRILIGGQKSVRKEPPPGLLR